LAYTIHENYLLSKLGGKKLASKINKMDFLESKSFYTELFNKKSTDFCQYATKNPLELIACDLIQKIISALDVNLNLIKNPIK